MHDAVIVGCGPTGLMLAGELRLAGVDAVVLERRASQELAGSRGGGIHSRTIELLDQRGIADRFLAAGKTVQTASFGNTQLDLGGLPTRHPYTLALFQNHIEQLLLEWVQGLGVEIRRGVEVTGVSADDDGAEVQLAGGGPVRGRYVVGTDGGRSVVRRSAGIPMVGPDATRSSLIAEVKAAGEPGQQGKVDARGIHGLYPMGGGMVRVVVTEASLGPATEPTLADLREALTQVFGTDFGVHSPTWLSRFTDATRQAEAYRKGRVLLAGDAAHVHSPTGGLGIGLGLQDAVNLGWKLGQVVRCVATEALLDTYHAERHPAGERALKYTMAQSLFQKADPRQEALRDLLGEVLRVDGAGTPIAALVTGLDVAYHRGPGHPLLGRRMPDLDLATPAGPATVYGLLHSARPLLLEVGGPALEAGSWAGRVLHTRATYDAAWQLPVLGTVAAPTAVLVRPDGYVAWVGQGSADGLAEALGTWFGPANP
ncbi:FAD-dependent monooxygenase [Pseudarthrobacter niigatensis]|uniref:3-(3-hydroxy-phenyl)propionate hydroxylase n=1 Tax=Pseudarthrobacter niigatensis TaxID=369935 RepID=A0AAJ1WFE1_9MICC|nr:FAD-dependent monooxygenase [Pseudarthrobacter niigatensis]MDQ0145932.1 3-(3-hydroxy-phenyl)propionate hydroxylase [Pseudarthrobacter niigatensis]MDQ0266340.1 3-(3-hydroxy-phenyl)propionate hydroxylase [Pseudarthrobacter niigatensis]